MSVRLHPASGASLTASSLTLDTPAQATPGMAVSLTGTYVGDPVALDYNFGSGWVEATATDFSNGIFSFTIPAGFTAGTYVPEVRDHNATSIVGTAGQFVVSAWTPETLTTSPGAKAIFEFNPGNPADILQSANGSVLEVFNSVDHSQYLQAEVATGGNQIEIANNSGAAGKSRLLQFHSTTLSDNIYDPAANWLGAGGVNGSAGSALVNLANSSDLATSGSFTTIIALDISTAYTYEAGPIWGTLAKPGPLQFAQLRYNNGSREGGAELVDSDQVGTNAQVTMAPGWHVMTMIKDGGLLEYRLDGQPVMTTTITLPDPFTAKDFLIGGGFPAASSNSAGAENGVPPPYVGEFQAYSGVLSGTDLANAEKLAGNSIGRSLNPNVPCFAAGTLILTSRGWIAVEHLQEGDRAVTRRHGCDHLSRIVWVGGRTVNVAAHPQPGSVRPIRFAPGALGEALPRRPLLVSPDHALLLDGHLIAARQLVNGATITVMDAASVVYVHVELERHGILLAEGVEAESYLDTGNRRQFENSGPLISLHPDFGRAGHPDACAPLATDAATVRPVWQRLADRAGLLGHAAVTLPATSRDAALRLVLPGGHAASPARILADGRHIFLLHEGPGSQGKAWLCSRHAAPADIRPWEDDRRQLGVAISRLRVATSQPATMREISLDEPALASGWHAREAGSGKAYRWTDGNAGLWLPPDCIELEVTVFAVAEAPASQPVELPAVAVRSVA